jgi:hypothetical protein
MLLMVSPQAMSRASRGGRDRDVLEKEGRCMLVGKMVRPTKVSNRDVPMGRSEKALGLTGG